MTVHQDRTFEDLRNTVLEYFRILRRRWRPALLGLTLVGTIAFWISQYLPREYSTSTLFERRDDVVLRNLVRTNSPYSFGQMQSSIALDLTGSRALADAAVAIGLLSPDVIQSKEALTNAELRRVDQALGKYKLRATVRQVQKSPNLDTLELSCTGNEPGVARRFVVALRDGYIRRTRAQINEMLRGTREFLLSEIEGLDRQISEMDRQMQDQYAEFHGVDPSNPNSAGLRLDALEADVTRMEQSVAELDAQIATREKFMTSDLLSESAVTYSGEEAAAVAPPILPETNSALDLAIKKVEQEITDSILLHRMTNEHPQVKTLQRKLDNLLAARDAARKMEPATETQAASATSPAPRPSALQRLAQKDPVMAGHRLRVELELDALRAQAEVARRHLEDARARKTKFAALYERLRDSGNETRRIEERIAQDKTTAGVWRQQLSQLERILAAENEERGTQFVLIEEPKESPRAIKPQASAIFAVCLGCGLAAAALLIALCELTDRSFRTANQVTRALGLPILECITVINTPKVRRRRMLARMFWTPTLGVLTCVFVVSALLAYASLEHPSLHNRAMSRINGMLSTLGAPPTALGKTLEEGGQAVGSMQKVMQKLRVKPDPGADVAVLAPPEADLGGVLATPAGSQGYELGGFTPDPAADQVSAAVSVGPEPHAPTETEPSTVALDPRTIEWDATQLDPSLIAYHERYSATSEQYRSFRARLLNMNAQHKHQMLAITSSLPQEGKSVTTLNLGMVMAEGNDQKVLLIDADFRRASIARMLGISPKPGLAELIRGSATLDEVLRPTHFPNLKILTCGGTADKNYGALLGASAVGPVMKKLRDMFDYSFVDTPPVNTVSDVSMLAPHCDGVIIVIEMCRTPEPSVLEAVRTLQTTNAKILGCLLSQYDDHRGHYYERYYSYYYHNE